MRRIFLNSLRCVCVASFIAVRCSFAADPNAGLEQKPKWTDIEQLQEKWGRTPLEELRAKAQGGDAEAQHYLGSRYLQGDGVSKDLSAAADWFHKAAEQGFALAQDKLATMYANGEGLTKDMETAIRLYRRAADQGLPAALRHLGELASAGKLPDGRPEDCLRLYELAAEQGDMAAAAQLGYEHIWGYVVQFRLFDIGVYWTAFAANNGYPRAISDLGWAYLEGNGVPKDYDEARRLFEKGSQCNEPRSHLGLAELELRRNENKPDLLAVRSNLLKAAESELPQAFHELGRLSELWDIVHTPAEKPDYSQAARWYRRAADAGVTKASERLTELTLTGKVTKGNLIVALQNASLRGDSKAALELARRYIKGEAKPAEGADGPVAILESLMRKGNQEAELELADLYRTGHLVSKDLMYALFLLHESALGYEEPGPGWKRFESLKRAVHEKSSVAPTEQGLEQVYPLYIDAVCNNQSSASAAKIADNYANGTYPTNDIAAYAWYSLAAERGDGGAALKRESLFGKFNPQAAWDATRMRNLLHYLPDVTNP